MGDRPVRENTVASRVNRVIRLAIDSGLEVARATLLVSAPWLNWPVLSAIQRLIFKVVGDQLYKFLAEHSTFLVIDFQTKQEKDAYMASLEQLRKAQAGGNDREIDEARKRAEEDLARLIRWDGHSSP